VSCVWIGVVTSLMGERGWLESGGGVEKGRLWVAGGGSAEVEVSAGAMREMLVAMVDIITVRLSISPWSLARAAAESA
jgi:hypothetical protein